MSNNVLITSIGTSTSINLYKLLKDYYIIGVDVNPFGYTAGSTMVDKYFQVPYATDPSYVNCLKNIVANNSIDVLIPVSDTEIKALVQEKDKFPCRIVGPTSEFVSMFDDKYKSSLLFQRYGYEIGSIIRGQQNLLRYEKIIKRKKFGVGSNGVEILKSGDVPISMISEDYGVKDFFLQEYVDGEEYTVDIACDDCGKPYLIIPRKRLEVKAGVATKVEIVNDIKLIELVKDICANFRMPYFSNIQFIKRCDKYYFIELNYRFGGMSIASVKASYNYVYQTLKSILETEKIEKKFLNSFPIKWGAIITRYFEEVMYYEK